MTFDKILENGRLWAVRYDGEKDNALRNVMAQWNDTEWLVNFFSENIDDLASYFQITDINEAIYRTFEDSDVLECVIMDISPDADLDKIFRPLENSRTGEMMLGKEKARPHRRSWLRLYAIKLLPGIYVITGGAIKLTHTMQERQHTLLELEKMENVRNFLINENIFDDDSFIEFQREAEP